MPDLTLKPMSEDLLAAAVGLDQICLGGLWNLAGYQQEFERDISTLLALTCSLDCSSDRPNLVDSLQINSPEINQSDQLLIGMGCSWRILEEMHITLIAVHPGYQRSGLGQILLIGLLWLGCQHRSERTTLEVRESNRVALALYEKFGFQVAGRRRRYYPDTGEDGLILWRGELEKPEFAQLLRQQQQQTMASLEIKGWHLQIASELNPCLQAGAN
ncbi:MAG: ribosomal protein S18-alanine N-acetyltransferase [Aphanocapsa sp. GSE-SYN-MK-11-07L]|jgi:ribosomal-protein-alanine N-acetyltransferase|nr:ribosomal protein S18-alanine N-acetyltransferase [Aphanocapsa sp. GSE-SYN-MK-11-07L]